MARVFLALQRGAFAVEKLVVVKQLRQEYAADEVFLAMFRDEARIALRLNNPNVVHTYEVVGEPPDVLLVMEYLEGQTLSQVLRKAGRVAFPLNVHIWVLTQVLAGLQYAHELRDLDGSALGVVHRDVSPANVLITSVGEVKLLDFGIAKAAGAASFTQQGIMKGKLGYASPEQCLAMPSDARTDLFAVGVMLWEAIAGRRRAIAETSVAAVQARVTNREPAIEDVVPDVSPLLAAICRKALAFEPEDRFASAQEFREELEKYLQATGSQHHAQKLSETMKRLFASEFAGVRAKVEACVQESRRSLHPIESSVSMLVRSSAITNRHSSTPAEAPRLSKAARFGVVGGLAVIGLLAIIALRSAPAPRTPTDAAIAAAVGPDSKPETVGAPARLIAVTEAPVRIAITVSPPSAQITLDGRGLSNPFAGELQRDAGEHELVVSARGHHSERRVISLTRDLDLALVLAPESNAGRNFRPTARMGTAARPAPVDAPQAAVTSAPAPRPAASPAQATPGQNLKKQARGGQRTIDERDPYQ